MKKADHSIPNKQKTDASEKLVRQNVNSDLHKSDVKALKGQNEETKDSDHKEENAANAKDNSGYYKSDKE